MTSFAWDSLLQSITTTQLQLLFYRVLSPCQFYRGLPVLPCGSDGKVSAYSAGDLGLIRGLGRSSGEGNGNPLQYSCLENPMDEGACWATVHGVSDLTSLHFTHSSVFLLSLSLMRLICHSSQGPSPTWDKLIRVRVKHKMGSNLG